MRRGKLDLTESEIRWLKRKWDNIRQSQMAADAANNEWNQINDAINEKHAAEDARRAERGDLPLTDLMKAEAKGASLALSDALGAGNWHSRNAERHIADVQLFLKLKELDIL
jgi:hypothetical protein